MIYPFHHFQCIMPSKMWWYRAWKRKTFGVKWGWGHYFPASTVCMGPLTVRFRIIHFEIFPCSSSIGSYILNYMCQMISRGHVSLSGPAIFQIWDQKTLCCPGAARSCQCFLVLLQCYKRYIYSVLRIHIRSSYIQRYDIFFEVPLNSPV